jgi:hypothetical protein
MNTYLARLVPLLLGSMALTAHATPIVGEIEIQAGSVMLTPNQLGAVNTVGPSTNGLVASVSGAGTSYPVSLDGDQVAYTSFTVTLGPQAVLPLWTLSGNGYTYSFDLASITSIVQTSTSLTIDGTGSLISTDPDDTGPTPGTWSYDINGGPTDGVFSFESNTADPHAPDGANTLILLCVGLLGLVGFGWRSDKALRHHRMVA